MSRARRNHSLRGGTALAAFLLLLVSGLRAQDEVKEIPVAALDRQTPVDFEKEVLPLFRKKCLACHNASVAKGDVVLETPETIREGADGEAIVVPGKGDESLIIKVAARRLKPFMPPPKNKVEAQPLTPAELGILKGWIDGGAKGTVGEGARAAQWHALAGARSIYAASLTEDGNLAAASRGNRVFLYSLSLGRAIAELSDPALGELGLYRERGAADLDNIQALAFEPQGDLLATGGYRTVKLWRRVHAVARSALPLPALADGAAAAVTALASRADGRWLAAGTGAGSVFLWEAVEGQGPAGPQSAIEKHEGAVTAVEFLAGGDRLVSASLDGSIRFWSVPAGEALGRIAVPATVRSLALLAGGGGLVAGGADGSLRLFKVPGLGEAPAGEPAATIAAHEKAVTALAAVPGAEGQCLSGGEDGMVRQWNVPAGQKVREMAQGAPVTAVAARPDGKRFASAGADARVKLWDAGEGKLLFDLRGGDYRGALPATRLARRLKVFTGRADDAKKALEAGEKEKAAKAEAETKAGEALAAADKALAEKKAASEEAAKAAAGDAAKKAAAEEAAKALKAAEEAQAKAKTAAGEATAARTEAAAAVERQKTALASAEAAAKEPAAAAEAAAKAVADGARPVRALAFSPDGARLAGGGDGGLVETWGVDDGTPLEAFQAHPAAVAAILFVAPGRLVAGGSGGAAPLGIWDLEPPWTLEKRLGSPEDPAGFADRVTALAFSLDGKLLAAASGEPSRRGEIKVWSTSDWSLLWSLPDAHSDAIFALEFTVDGEYLATCGADKFVRVFHAADGKRVKSFEGHTGHVFGVSWRFDGKILASCDADKTIKVWDFESGEQRRTIGGFGKQVTAIRFVGDTGNTVASSGDRTVRLHQTDNGNAVRTFDGATDYVYSVASTPDGRLIAAGGFDGVLRIYNAADGKLLRAFEPPK